MNTACSINPDRSLKVLKNLSPELKMRAIVGSIRIVRSACTRSINNYSSTFVRRRSHLIQINSTPVYILPHNAAIHRFSFRPRPFSAGAATKVDATVAEVNRGGPLVEYERRISAGELFDGDACQVGTLTELQRLYDEIVVSAAACRLDRYQVPEKTVRWFWSRLMPQSPQSSCSPVKGLYLYGGVGTGKTMLMDLFFDQLPCNWRKKRIHFHDFMLDVHGRLQKHKGVADPLEVVAGEISDEAILLCLDEFMVTDVADALILNRLFRHLYNNGVILVATSNRAPDNLYEGGLQRDLFLPFIATLKERCVVHEIGSAVDYRKLTSAEEGFYFIGKDLSSLLKQNFQQLIGEHVAASPQLVEVVMDYFGLFKNFHTLALEGIPKLGLHNRTAAYRFVTLVDVMYENKARLLCTAEGSPLELFENIVTVSDAQNMAPRTSSRSRRNDDSNLCVDNELGFAKDRTISRLTEMNSKEYLEQHAEERQSIKA
ncbi:putative Clathrin assembly protein [Hibiscus syriacus]|uniref:Clathrin assembly protein n=1 Tax=Hibiscus syriacus TaxID=106335 RepID=A0A6A3B6B8_HIBSY|nr:putative Clathrin assembly protein [Hibiscus syriacus]